MHIIMRIWLSFTLLLIVVAFAKAQTDNSQEAERHYRIAMVALKENDLDVAQTELKRAAALAPTNALTFYYLARVEEKSGMSGQALLDLKKAMSFGLPKDEADNAETFLAELSYKIQKQAQSDWLIGTWMAQQTDSANTVSHYRPGVNYVVGMTNRTQRFTRHTIEQKAFAISRPERGGAYPVVFSITTTVVVEGDGRHDDKSYEKQLELEKTQLERKYVQTYTGFITVKPDGSMENSELTPNNAGQERLAGFRVTRIGDDIIRIGEGSPQFLDYMRAR